MTSVPCSLTLSLFSLSKTQQEDNHNRKENWGAEVEVAIVAEKSREDGQKTVITDV